MASGARVEIFDAIDSTSLEAKRRAAAGEIGPLWIAAIRQTAGYGRLGAAWAQSEGDIAATFLFNDRTGFAALPQLSFVAALAVYDAIRRYAPTANISVKWPNDILVGGGKIAGLLLELLGSAEAPVIAIGVGVNVVSAPEGLRYPTSRLLDLTPDPPQPPEFISTLDDALAHWRGIWTNSGFRPIREEWLRRAARRGESIRVRLAHETLEGVFADLDFDGALILECWEGRRRIVAGAVLPARTSAVGGAGRDENADRN